MDSEGDWFKEVLFIVSYLLRFKSYLMNLFMKTLHIFMALRRHSSTFTGIISFDPPIQRRNKPYYHFHQLLLFFFEYFMDIVSLPFAANVSVLNVSFFSSAFKICSSYLVFRVLTVKHLGMFHLLAVF